MATAAPMKPKAKKSASGEARPGERVPRRKGGRRKWFRTLAGVGLGGVAVQALVPWRRADEGYRTEPAGTERVIVTDNCVGCTGCVAVCPTAAIVVIPESIEVDQEKCVSCGYCLIGCAVDGIRVVRPLDG